MTQTFSPPVSIPAAPRPVTARGRRRAWGEAGVAVWWKLALAVLVVAIYVGYMQSGEALKHRRLMRTGVVVDARAVKVQGVTPEQNARFGVMRDQTVPVEFQARLPDGREVLLSGYLPRGEGRIEVNQEMQLRVDPGDWTNWGEVIDVDPWWRVLALPLLLLLPIVLLLLALAYWRRGQVLKAWRDGTSGEAVVLETRQSATAPMSRVLRFTLADSTDRRVFSLLFPNRGGVPAKGETFPIVYPPNRPDRAIAASLYTDRSD